MNKMMSDLETGAKSIPFYMPPCALYKLLLDEAQRRFCITRDRARQRYGLYSYRQWYNLLKQNEQ